MSAAAPLFAMPSPFATENGQVLLLEPPEASASELRARLLDESYARPFVVDDGQQRFLHGLVSDISLGQYRPRHQRAFVAFLRGIRPARGQQRLRRERPLETHAIKMLFGQLRLLGFQQPAAEYQVGLVLDGQCGRIGGTDLAGTGETEQSFLVLAVAKWSYSEVL